MKKTVLAAALLAGAPAGAATVALGGIGVDGNGDTQFTYRAAVGAQDSLHRGSTFVIYDFAGYVDGSIFSSGANLAGRVEMVSALPTSDGLFDDPHLVNLVFTYVGSPIRNFGGALDIGGFGASSILPHAGPGNVRSSTVRYDVIAGGTARAEWQAALLVPMPIPEPGAWMMLIAGFGLVGAAIRRRRRPAVA